MPLIAFVAGFAALLVWQVLLLAPLGVIYGLIILVGMAFGVALNAAAGAGIAIMLLPAIIYMPAVFLSFTVPAFMALFDGALKGAFRVKPFGVEDAIALPTYFGRRFLAAIGIGRKPAHPGR